MRNLHQNINTIVIVGSWNIAIFTPDWIKKNVLREEDFPEFRIEYPLNVLQSLRYTTGNFAFYIAENKLLFSLLTDSTKAEKELISVINTICQKLPHTPVSALGINFWFETDKEIEALNGLSDTKKIVETLGTTQQSINVVRSFKKNDVETLNFKIIKIETNKPIYDFNYDYKVSKIEEITEIINNEEDIIGTKKEEAQSILKAVYNETENI